MFPHTGPDKAGHGLDVNPAQPLLYIRLSVNRPVRRLSHICRIFNVCLLSRHNVLSNERSTPQQATTARMDAQSRAVFLHYALGRFVLEQASPSRRHVCERVCFVPQQSLAIRSPTCLLRLEMRRHKTLCLRGCGGCETHAKTNPIYFRVCDKGSNEKGPGWCQLSTWEPSSSKGFWVGAEHRWSQNRCKLQDKFKSFFFSIMIIIDTNTCVCGCVCGRV